MAPSRLIQVIDTNHGPFELWATPNGYVAVPVPADDLDDTERRALVRHRRQRFKGRCTCTPTVHQDPGAADPITVTVHAPDCLDHVATMRAVEGV